MNAKLTTDHLFEIGLTFSVENDFTFFNCFIDYCLNRAVLVVCISGYNVRRVRYYFIVHDCLTSWKVNKYKARQVLYYRKGEQTSSLVCT